MIFSIYFTLLIFFVSFILSVIAFKDTEFLKNIGKGDLYLITLLLVFAVITKYPFRAEFFFGLEYEDAYIYNAYSRLLLYLKSFEGNSFLTQGCLYGSLNDCKISGTYSGHLIAFSSIAYLINKCIGYTPHTICFLNFTCSLVSVFLIYLISKIIISSKVFAFIASSFYVLTPGMNIFHSSSLSETFSSTFILLFLFLYLISIVEKPGTKFKKINLFLSIFFVLFFCSLIKRENLLLLFIPLITMVLNFFDERKTFKDYKNELLFYIIASFIVLIFYLTVINVLETVKVENIEVEGGAFQLGYLISLLPVFIKSFFTVEWFSIFSYIFIMSSILFLCKLPQNHLLSYPFVMFLLYLFLYSLHYRSYYFGQTGEITEFETLRYITNFFPFYCIIAGFSIFKINHFLINKYFTHTIKRYTVVVSFLIVLLAAMLIYQTIDLRNKFSGIELESRISPIIETIGVVSGQDSLVITDKPLLFQVFGPNNFRVLDLSLLEKDFSYESFSKLIQTFDLYYFKDSIHNKEIQIRRYPHAYKMLSKFEKHKVMTLESSSADLFSLKMKE